MNEFEDLFEQSVRLVRYSSLSGIDSSAAK
jgi:hypothetical protein